VTRLSHHLVAAAAAWLVLLTGDIGYAGEDISEISGEAADHYKRGRELYSSGDYAASARALRRAYDQAEATYPLILYNIALAEWRAGQHTRALETARRADEADLPESVIDKNRAMIRGLETRRTAATVADAPQPTRRVSKPPDTEPPSPDPEPTDDGRAGFGPGGWTGVGLATLGAASLGTAIWMDRRMARKFGDYRAAARHRRLDDYNRLNRELKRDKRLGLALLGAGVVTTGLGVYLIGTNASGSTTEATADSSAPEMTLLPTAGPERVGALIRLRWRPFAR